MTQVYNDEYPTCSRTYLGLRIFHDSLSPKEITDLLRVTPSLTREKEETKPSYWTLSTEDFVDSFDLRRHIDWTASNSAEATYANFKKKLQSMFAATGGQRTGTAAQLYPLHSFADSRTLN